MQPDAVFQIVAAGFAELGAADPQAIGRTLLLRDGYFVGHRFRCGGLQAILLPESESVEFFDAEGGPLRSVPLPQAESRKAA
ncbi:MAG: hypothetical protein GXY83_35520 [Rhodopirellula sp.]|nr:hypothetical protein [Rhodopirellula sp.]